MKTDGKVKRSCLLLFQLFLLSNCLMALDIEMVRVGNAGNAADITGYGSVSYEYNIGQYEVTAGQYAEFLNTTAVTDPYGLYNENMANPAGSPKEYGCNIIQNGTPGNYTYSVSTDWGNRPVNYVSWYDAARFCNFLTTGNTEQGVYRFDPGGNFLGIDISLKTGPGKAYWIPTEDEWYKAAYHQNNGVGGDYWNYPTQTNMPPSNGIYFIGEAQANFETISVNIYSPYFFTEVGFFENYASAYGTFDQGGNVWEWNESLVNEIYRGIRGGGFASSVLSLSRSARVRTNPVNDLLTGGFRVASNVVPEPSTFFLVVIGACFLNRKFL